MAGGSPDGDAVAVDLGDARVRFHRVVIDHRKVELVLDDHVRLGKTFGDIAFDKLVMGANIFLGKCVQPRRTVGHRLFHADQRRQLGILDVNLAQRLFCRRLVDGRHRRHRLAGVDHPVHGDDRLILPIAAPHVRADIGKIFAGKNRADAGQRLRLPGIDRDNPRMSVGAAQEHAFDHPWNDQIGDILRPARDLIGAVDPRHRVADHGKAAFVSAHTTPLANLKLPLQEIETDEKPANCV